VAALPLDIALEEATAPTEALEAVEASHLGMPLADALPVSEDVVSAGAAPLPSRILPVSNFEPELLEPISCKHCGTLIPPERRSCPSCETRQGLLAALEADAVDVEPVPPSLVVAKPFEIKPIHGWLVVGSILAAVCVAALLWSL
jgi:hypothetical protein